MHSKQRHKRAALLGLKKLGWPVKKTEATSWAGKVRAREKDVLHYCVSHGDIQYGQESLFSMALLYGRREYRTTFFYYSTSVLDFGNAKLVIKHPFFLS